MTHAEVMKLLFEEPERELEAMRIVVWEMEIRRRIQSLEEGNP